MEAFFVSRDRSIYEREMLEKLVDALRSAFSHSREVALHDCRALKMDGPGALIQLKAENEIHHVVIDILRTAYPRDIRRTIWKLEESETSVVEASNVIRLVAAESLSPGAKSLLIKKGYAFFETSGSLYVRSRNFFINIERESQTNGRSALPSLFTDAREAVVHALLKNALKWTTGAELAELSGSSPYTCSVVMQELERREWCESKGAGPSKRRRLIKPGVLLDAWAEQWKKRNGTDSRWYAFVADPRQLLTRITVEIEDSQINFPWAFTGTSAANIYAPLLTGTDNVEIVVPPGFTMCLAQALKLKPASKGANVSIIEREGASLLFRDRGAEFPAYFASHLIMYLDLLNGRGRNKELAAHLRAQFERSWGAKQK